MSDGRKIGLPNGKFIIIPAYIEAVLIRLNSSGFEAFAVGGCIRDSMIGITPHDYDICTNASSSEIKAVFSDFKTVDTGIKHGTVTVVSSGHPVEVTTYRVDGEYKDHRRPEEVVFTEDIYEDLKRRDFTVNAMAVDSDGRFCSADGGASDVEKRIIRCVGDPYERFEEDALRILRAMRFAARFGFEIESKTLLAMHEKRKLLRFVSAERIFQELSGLLSVENGEAVANVIRNCREITATVIPEFIPGFECDQYSRHHSYSVWEHILKAVSISPARLRLRWALLLHDIAKPYCMVRGVDGRGHFPGHDLIGAEFSRDILKRLKAPNDITDGVYELLLKHDLRFKVSSSSAARLLGDCGPDLLADLFEMMRCDILSQSEFKRAEKLGSVEKMQALVNKHILEKSCVSRAELAINGDRLIELGIARGPGMKTVLNGILDAVINGEIENTEDDIVLWVKRNIN